MLNFDCKFSHNLRNALHLAAEILQPRETISMELGKLDRQLRLMVLLAGNSSLTNEEIASRLSLSKRSVYRYLEAFRDMGFVVERSGDIYRLDKNSPFFREISGGVMFTEDEAATVSQLLASVGDNSTRAKNLRRKLERIYDYKVLENHEADRRLSENTSRLYEAVKQHLTVVLKSYRSLRGGSVSDRVVEPYRFMNSNDDVRCYELASGQNKTFKISRIGEVGLLDVKWIAEPAHERIYTDAFGFTGTPIDTVSLRLTARAASLLCEEYPQARPFVADGADGTSVFEDRVCSYLGAMRFVFGLYSDVEVAGSEKFMLFLKEKSVDLTLRFAK